MEETDIRRVLRRHLAISKRVRALDPHKDCAELAEERLREFAERLKELLRLRSREPEENSLLNGAIEVSKKLLKLKQEQFKLPVPHGDDDTEGEEDEGGAGVPAPVAGGPRLLSGCGARKFADSEEANDW